MLKPFIFTLLIFISSYSFAQNKYWVLFTDKEGVTFDPKAYFDQKAIDRRVKNGLPLNHETDRPVKQEYLDKVDIQVEKSLKVTRWLNGVSILAYPEQVSALETLPFVRDIFLIKSQALLSHIDNHDDKEFDLSNFDKALLKFQTERMQANLFWEKDIKGQGMRIAIFDVGFPGVDEHPVFEHLRKNNKIIATYDFIKENENVYIHQWHGTAVLACISGILDGVPMGIATEAEFLLARTEHFILEPFSEEENWLAAVEWADKNGADIISSSLGYTKPRYNKKDMDGHTSLIARAANIAASKGILVLNAAGNDGSKNWKYICTPGDADSVLTVGGTDPETDMHISFSSFGPTADKRFKPNVTALGKVITATTNRVSVQTGTSFATPLVAGFAACAWQLNPKMTNMEMFKAIESSGHLYPYFDYAHGYGIPQASYFTEDENNVPTATFSFVEIAGQPNVKIDSSFLPIDNSTILNLYYHIRRPDGIIIKYGVILVETEYPYSNLSKFLKRDETLMVHFEGYTLSFNAAEH